MIEHLDAGEIDLGHAVLPVTLRCDRRARRLTLRLVPGGVRVTAPSRRHLRQARALVEQRRDWLAARLAERPTPVPFAYGTVLPVAGEAREVVRAPSARWAARLVPGRIETGGADEAGVARRVERLLRAEALASLTAASDGYAAALGLPPCPVAVRETRSRWGSCSSGGTLSYAWRLILAPPGVLAYVAAHECAHRVHLDHSPAFWSVVGRLRPGFRAEDAWLKRNGASLHAYGAGPAPCPSPQYA